MRGRTNIISGSGGLGINGVIKKYEIAEGDILKGDFVEATSDENIVVLSETEEVKYPMQSIYWDKYVVIMKNQGLYLFSYASNSITLQLQFTRVDNANANMIDNEDGTFWFVNLSSKRLYKIDIKTLTTLTSVDISGLTNANYISNGCLGICKSGSKFIILCETSSASASNVISYNVFTVNGSSATQLNSSTFSFAPKVYGKHSYVCPKVVNGAIYVSVLTYRSSSNTREVIKFDFNENTNEVTYDNNVNNYISAGYNLSNITNGGVDALIDEGIVATLVGFTTSERLQFFVNKVKKSLPIPLGSSSSYHRETSCMGKTPYGLVIAASYVDQVKQSTVLRIFLYNSSLEGLIFKNYYDFTAEELGFDEEFITHSDAATFAQGTICSNGDKIHMFLQFVFRVSSGFKYKFCALDFSVVNDSMIVFNSLIKIKPCEKSIVGVANENGTVGDLIGVYTPRELQEE